MDGVTLESRAVLFAISVGAFTVALVATPGGGARCRRLARTDPGAGLRAMCRASAERSIAGIAPAIDAAIVRLPHASHGDLSGVIPAEIGENVLQLADAMQGLFEQLQANLDGAHRLATFDPVTALATARTSAVPARCLVPASGGSD